jgi:hypothetical protein
MMMPGRSGAWRRFVNALGVGHDAVTTTKVMIVPCRLLDHRERSAVHVIALRERTNYRHLRISLPSYISLQRYRQYVATKMMTPAASVTRTSRMGRKKLWPERTAIKFPAGTFERIAAILDEGEDRMTFMREAVEREVERREAAGKRKKPHRRL